MQPFPPRVGWILMKQACWLTGRVLPLPCVIPLLARRRKVTTGYFSRPSCFIKNVTEQSIVASEIMLPKEDMRRSSVKEYTDTMKQRYTGASRTDKSALLVEERV